MTAATKRVERRPGIQLRDKIYYKRQEMKGNNTEQRTPLGLKGKNLLRIPRPERDENTRESLGGRPVDGASDRYGLKRVRLGIIGLKTNKNKEGRRRGIELRRRQKEKERKSSFSPQYSLSPLQICKLVRTRVWGLCLCRRGHSSDFPLI